MAAILLGSTLTGTANAAAADAGAGMFLTVSGSENTWIRGVLLHCDPPGGSHPAAEAACADLAAAGGDFDALPGDPHRCTKEYDPVTATATGTYNGRPVAWHRTFPNACVMDGITGPVFRF